LGSPDGFGSFWIGGMGEENFIIWLDPRTYIAVDFLTVDGKVVTFVVRLMRIEASGDRVLSRFDTAHGRPHHDLLTAKGNLAKKVWMDELSFDDALSYAIKHFKEHHADYES
jgi:hypothetical protein